MVPPSIERFTVNPSELRPAKKPEAPKKKKQKAEVEDDSES